VIMVFVYLGNVSVMIFNSIWEVLRHILIVDHSVEHLVKKYDSFTGK
jgi:hypothetical protein